MAPKIERPNPAYMQIVGHIRDQIKSGELRPGDRVMSIREIQREFKVANATAVKALAALKTEGLTESREGIGTVVKEQRNLTTGPDRLQLMRATGSGFRPGERVEIVMAGLVPASTEVASALGVDQGASVVQRQRAYYDDEGIIALSTSWLSGELAEAAPELARTEALPKMTFGLIEDRTGRRAVRRRDVVKIQHVPAEYASILEVEPGNPALTMTNTYWDQDERVTEYAVDFLGVGRELSAEYDLTA